MCKQQSLKYVYACARKCMFCLEKCWIVANVFNIKMKTTLTELQFLGGGDDILSFVCPNNYYFLTIFSSSFPYINSICSLLFPPAFSCLQYALWVSNFQSTISLLCVPKISLFGFKYKFPVPLPFSINFLMVQMICL